LTRGVEKRKKVPGMPEKGYRKGIAKKKFI
jgi:hypothetical protein